MTQDRLNAMPDDLPAGVSVIVPVYNSQGTLPTLIERLSPVLDTLPGGHELILVDDGSRDESWATIESLCESHDWVVGLQLAKNFGQHNALLCGLLQARYAMSVTMDDDLQNPPEEVAKLLGQLEDGYDLVYGKPEHDQQGPMRNAASWFTKLALQSVMGAETARQVSAFRALKTRLRGAFADHRGPAVSIDVLLTWATRRCTAITVRHDPRTVGQSNYGVRKLVAHAFNMITGFSTLPLHVASWVGFAFMLFGMALLVYVVGVFLVHGRAVPGFAFLASAIAIFSGAQLFALGMIGEYLARIHWRTMDRPTFVVRTRVGQGAPAC